MERINKIYSEKSENYKKSLKYVQAKNRCKKYILEILELAANTKSNSIEFTVNPFALFGKENNIELYMFKEILSELRLEKNLLILTHLKYEMLKKKIFFYEEKSIVLHGEICNIFYREVLSDQETNDIYYDESII